MARRQTKSLLTTVFIALVAANGLQAGAILAKYSDSSKCMPCHTTITKDWMSSLHAKSHFSKNPLYAAMLKYTAKKKHQTVARMELRCAQCHNPHVSDAVSSDEMEAADFGFDSKAIRKKMSSPFIKDGVNCIVCHNIETIHPSVSAAVRGKDVVKWGPNDTMVGPFKDAKSPYHKTAYADFFRKDPNKLCFVCHYNERSTNGAKIGSTGEEYESSGSRKSCVECHMGPLHEARAVQRDLPGSTADKIRPMRRHLFAGVRNSDIVSQALKLSYTRVGSRLQLKIENLTPHKLPTGFAGRLLRINARFFDAKGKEIGSDHYDIKTDYVDPQGHQTIPYLAAKVTRDNRIAPLGSKTIALRMPEGTARTKIVVDYYLVAPEWAKKLKVTDPTFTKAYRIASMEVE